MKADRTPQLYMILTVILFLILSLSVFFFYRAASQEQIPSPGAQTEWVYVYVTEEATTAAPTETEAEEEGWFLRAYQGKIGIFSESGNLINIIDTNIKTLPQADRILLEEGIYTRDRAQLYAWIEDYSE